MWEDPLLELLFKRGLEHEAKYVESPRTDGRRIVDLSDVNGREEKLKQTLDAMRGGADVIVQGALRDGRWFGKPDVMQRWEKPSDLGAWSYEISDETRARDARRNRPATQSLIGDARHCPRIEAGAFLPRHTKSRRTCAFSSRNAERHVK